MSAFRVAMVTPYTHPVVGGITTFVTNLAEALRNKGLEVTVVSRAGIQGDGVAIVDGPSIRFARAAAKCIRAFNPDAVHSHAHWYTLDAAVRACRVTRARTVFSFHTLPTHLGRVRSWAFHHLLTKCDYITFPSENLRGQVRLKLPEEKVRIVHPGVAHNRAAPAVGQFPRIGDAGGLGAFTIGYVGKFEWPLKVRGFEILLQALCRPELSGARLLAAGGGSLLPQVSKEIEGLGLANRVALLGEMPDPSCVYREADVYCHPSLQEGMSIAVLEAMNAGLPIVGIDRDSLRESVRDGVDGVIVDPTADALASGLAGLAADPILRKKLGDSARIRVLHEFNWDRSARQFMSLYGVNE